MENRMQSEIIEALKMLGFLNIEELPSLKNLRREFFSSARKNHPDKNSEADKITKEENEERFKKILNAYQIVAEAIFAEEENSTEEDDDDDEDMET